MRKPQRAGWLRWYVGVLLPAYSRAFRLEYGEDMKDTYVDRYSALRRRLGILAIPRVLGYALWHSLRDGMLERVRNVRRNHSDNNPITSVVVSVTQDLCYTLRSFKRQPMFLSVVSLIFALGIGANTVIFSIVNGVLLRPLPYAEPDRLVIPFQTHPHWLAGPNPVLRAAGQRFAVSYPVYEDWLEQNTVFESLGIQSAVSYIAGGRDQVERLAGTRVTHGVFDALGVQPILGRTFVPDDDEIGGQGLVVLSHGLWQRRFGADSTVIGQTMVLDEQTFTIVGVMPQGFYFPAAGELWTTFSDADRRSHRNSNYVWPIARLRPDVTLERAQREMEILAQHLKEVHPIPRRDYGVNVVYLEDDVVRNVRSAFLLLLGSVGIFLLISCANIANLLLVRASERRHELAVRLSLGASGGHIFRQLLTEGATLSVIGGALGTLVALVCVDPFAALLPSNTPRLDEIGVDIHVLAFSAGLTILTGIVAAALPALGAIGVRPTTVLQSTSRSLSGSRQTNRTLTCLLVSEIALTFVLLFGAGLLIKSFSRLMSVERGFNAERVVTMRVDMRGSRYGSADRLRSAYGELLERLEAIPGVTMAAAAGYGPLAAASSESMMVETSSGEVFTSVLMDNVSTSYFRTMTIPLIAGRLFMAEESEHDAPIAIVNAAMAHVYWPNESAIGKRIRKGQTAESDAPWLTIVGVVGSVRYRLDEDPHFTVYRPLRYGNPMMVIKTAVDPTLVFDAARAAVRAVDPTVPIVRLATLEDTINRSVAGPRMRALLLSSLAALAAILAVVGIFGVLAFAVVQRTNEIGIRMALGAKAGEVMRGVVSRGLIHLGFGLGIGLIVSLIAVRTLERFLFEIDPVDPATLLSVTFLLAVAAMAASFLPARRAARVDPVEALRRE